MNRPSQTSLLGRFLALGIIAIAASACYAHVQAGDPNREECRNVYHNKHDVETCHTNCHDDVCHRGCDDRERESREKRCWVD